eukprot:918880-Prorocentrum_lima.AAC.1
MTLGSIAQPSFTAISDLEQYSSNHCAKPVLVDGALVGLACTSLAMLSLEKSLVGIVSRMTRTLISPLNIYHSSCISLDVFWYGFQDLYPQ